MSSLLYNFKSACVSSVVFKAPRYAAWVNPPKGFYKFNVDGSAIGKPGPAGIGGVLGDWLGVVKGMFSISIGVADSNFAELRAILEALEMFGKSEGAGHLGLIIESDSANAVMWANDKDVLC